MTNKTKKDRLNSISVKNVAYKWRLDKLSIGTTLKIWKNKCIVVEEWFVSLPVGGITPEYIEEMIKFEKL